MTDCVLFGVLFATYAVLRDSTHGGPSAHDLFDIQYVLVETVALLTSSYTCGLALLYAYANNRRRALEWLAATFVLGALFLGLEIYEFTMLTLESHSWTASAFLSAFFTLVGTHGIHIAIGLLWLGVVMWQIYTRGFTGGVMRRFVIFSLFWHFLDIIWIFIFTFVYMMGVL